jgi:hypothetical protein
MSWLRSLTLSPLSHSPTRFKQVKLDAGGGLAASAVDGALQTAGARAQASSGTPVVKFLLQCVARATAPAAVASAAAAVCVRRLCCARAVRSLLGKLADDEKDDLYFEGGEHKLEMQVSGRCPSTRL